MWLNVSNKITIHEPTLEIKHWCEKNLIIPNPEYARKQRMGLWVGKTPKTICLYETVGDSLIVPFGTMSLLPENVWLENDITTVFGDKHEIDYKGKPVPLYDYQQEAVKVMVDKKRGILCSPTGSGKTQIGIEIIKQLGVRTLWVTHTLDLVQQSKNRALQYIDESLIGTISEGKVNISEGVTFATVQTLNKLNLDEYKFYWDLIIVDECHRVSGTPTSITMFSNVLNSLGARKKIGLSATVHRSDGMMKATYCLIGGVSHVVPKESVQDKVMKVSVLPRYTHVGVDRSFLNFDGTINYAKFLNYLAEHSERNSLIVDDIVSEKDKSCLVLSDRVGHLENLRNLLPEDLFRQSVIVTGKMTSKKGRLEREQAIEDMRTGVKKIMFATFSLAKEGLDIPCLERLFMVTPQKDFAVVTQSLGRIARKHEGKKPPVCFDYVDNNSPYGLRVFKSRERTYKHHGYEILGGY